MSDKPGWTERLFGGFRKTSERLSENLAALALSGKRDAGKVLRVAGSVTFRQNRERLAEEGAQPIFAHSGHRGA